MLRHLMPDIRDRGHTLAGEGLRGLRNVPFSKFHMIIGLLLLRGAGMCPQSLEAIPVEE